MSDSRKPPQPRGPRPLPNSLDSQGSQTSILSPHSTSSMPTKPPDQSGLESKDIKQTMNTPAPEIVPYFLGSKVIIDERKGHTIPQTLVERATYLPHEKKYYDIVTDKSVGKNVGWFAEVHFEYIDRNGAKTIEEQKVLIKKSETEQDISEFIAGKILNTIAGDIAAPIIFCSDSDNNYIVSLMYPGFEDAWKRFYDFNNETKAKHEIKPVPLPADRPKFVGSINKDLQNNIAERGEDATSPELNPKIDYFYMCFALAFLMRNLDFHFANLGVVYTIKETDPPEILRDAGKIKNLVQLKVKLRQATDAKQYNERAVAYYQALEDAKVQESHVLIDHGWSHAKWRQQTESFLKFNKTGIEAKTTHIPGAGPTNHFKEIKRAIKYTPKLANVLDEIQRILVERENEIKSAVINAIKEVDNYYGHEGLRLYAQYIGLKKLNKEKDIKQEISDFILKEALPAERLVAEKIALEIRLSYCFPEEGEWKDTKDGPKWEGTGKFNANLEKYKEFLEDYQNSNIYNHEKSVRENLKKLKFRGPGQAAHKSSLKEMAVNIYDRTPDLHLEKRPPKIIVPGSSQTISIMSPPPPRVTSSTPNNITRIPVKSPPPLTISRREPEDKKTVKSPSQLPGAVRSPFMPPDRTISSFSDDKIPKSPQQQLRSGAIPSNPVSPQLQSSSVGTRSPLNSGSSSNTTSSYTSPPEKSSNTQFSFLSNLTTKPGSKVSPGEPKKTDLSATPTTVKETKKKMGGS